ncbi:hypothetical protein D9757_008393 [Collybiopsis confluens]|uniref:Uncharacterized protein n=1 Tax=Collybiopsis confluens TaxID=2823264 RepID=A0A8H5HI38_9AGAR|nr:hypothetical protein D9757_008393 [Collybiopsis confluens]
MSESLPDGTAVANASSFDLLDKSGKKVNFGSLFKEKKIIVVFIRHFFCGSCQKYVSQLNSQCQKFSKSMEETNTEIFVIGCGKWQPIEMYSEMTGFPSSKIFADTDLNVYHAFGMNIRTTALTPAGQQRASYLTEGPIMNAISSTWRALMNAKFLGKQGDISQLGGEFILGPGGSTVFFYNDRSNFH